MKHICQGTKCHTYDTQSRVRGVKGAKVLRTRNARYEVDNTYRWTYPWEQYFCDERCMQDWLRQHMTQLINYVGINTKPSETPIDVVQEEMDGWRGKYTRTTIKFLSEPTIDDSITT